MNIKRFKQPADIKSGDLVLIIEEEQNYGLFINKKFKIGLIDKTKSDGRFYQLCMDNGDVKIIYDKEIGAEEFWIKKEFIKVISRIENGKVINYHIDVKEEENDFWDTLGDLLREW